MNTPGATVVDECAPAGFRPLTIEGGFMLHNGPIWVREDAGDPIFGFRIRVENCNPMGFSHGGWIASMLDTVMPLTARFAMPDLATRFSMTVSLSVDYLGGAPSGAWVEGRGQLLRRTGRLLFLQGLLGVDGEAIARGSGVFRLGPEGAPPIRRPIHGEV